jgi:SAM-dependent methyltransferase
VTQQPEWVPADLDVTRPSIARVYDYLLGGAHNFEVDRRLADEISRLSPGVVDTARANRHFLRRAVRFLVAAGIRQFLDIGSGIPTVGNVHEVAQKAAADSRVVYVDVDPIAVAQSQALLQGSTTTAVLCVDLRDPAKILAEATGTGLIDLDQPVAVLLAAVLHFLPDSAEPGEVVRQLREATAPGSYLLISHATSDGERPDVLAAQRLTGRTATSVVLRSHAEISAFFGAFTLVEPGLVPVDRWRPDHAGEPDPDPERMAGYAGVGRNG